MRALVARALLALLVAAALGGVAIARLRRVPRPRFEPVARFAGGRVVLGRVALARAGAPLGTGQLVGWSLTCGGREVIARLGAAHALSVAETPAGLRVRDGQRAATLDPRACAVRWDDATGRGAR